MKPNQKEVKRLINKSDCERMERYSDEQHELMELMHSPLPGV